MDKREFKKTLAKVLSEYSFTTQNNIARLETDGLIIVVATQKSNYENKYYLNFGIVIKELHPDLHNPKDNQCDVFGRLNLTITGELKTSVDYESIDSENFSIALRESLNRKIKPILEIGLLKYLELYSATISTVNLKAKKYLGLD